MEEVKRKRNVRNLPSLQVGRGLPNYFMPIIERRRSQQPKLKKELTPSEFSVFSASLNLAEYKFEDEEAPAEGKKQDIDVTALDRYNDEVRRYRKILIDECRRLPSFVTPDANLEVLEDAVIKLGRNAYFGTAKSQRLAEGAVPLLVWLMNRKYFPQQFTVNAIKSISEMCWSSIGLKAKFHKSHGTKVLYQHMTHAHTKKRIACWCCYALAMICTGSAEMIIGARTIKGLEEMVAELSFEYYWYDWPVNFGMVLQGIVYGPESVSPTEELFQFQ